MSIEGNNITDSLVNNDVVSFNIVIDHLDSSNINNYGALHPGVMVTDFQAHGFEVLDLVEVSFLNKQIIIPIVPDYNYIDSGMSAISLNNEQGLLSLMATGGQFVILHQLAHRIDRDWIKNDNVTLPFKMTFTLFKRKGYQETYDMYAFLFKRRTNIREDYPLLSDEEFVNFREVTFGNISHNKLYRSSSPISNKYNRDRVCDAICEKYNLHKFVNLSDAPEDVEIYKIRNKFLDTYYSKQNYLLLGLPADYYDPYFNEGLVNLVRFIIKDNSPVLVHCIEGKDRTGFVIAVFEALMGAKVKEIMYDYLISYLNFFKIDMVDNFDLCAVIQVKIIDYLSQAYKSKLNDSNLQMETEKYLLSIGLEQFEINDLKRYLGGE